MPVIYDVFKAEGLVLLPFGLPTGSSFCISLYYHCVHIRPHLGETFPDDVLSEVCNFHSSSRLFLVRFNPIVHNA